MRYWKVSLHSLAPRPYEALRGVWHKYRELWLARLERQRTRINRAILERYGPVVLSGPFAGMAYVRQAAGSCLAPKLIGCYEAELHGVVARILRTGYTQIVDIGCAEGYYAVGLARSI